MRDTISLVIRSMTVVRRRCYERLFVLGMVPSFSYLHCEERSERTFNSGAEDESRNESEAGGVALCILIDEIDAYNGHSRKLLIGHLPLLKRLRL